MEWDCIQGTTATTITAAKCRNWLEIPAIGTLKGKDKSGLIKRNLARMSS